MPNRYMDEIRSARVDRGSVCLWWLGQNGFVFKTPRGVTFSTDAYLSDSCRTLGERMGMNMARTVPVFVPPAEFSVDYFLCTHSHQDHADPETISALRKDRTQFAGPGLACEVFARCGVAAERSRQLYPGGRYTFGDVTVHGCFAQPTDDTDLNHMGFVFEVEDGPRIYMTGDTDYSDLLGSVAKLEPQLLITCINGGFNNLSHWEAADLARLVAPRAAIPCHYDMFPDNYQNPETFRASLKYKAPAVSYQRLEHMRPFVFKAV